MTTFQKNITGRETHTTAFYIFLFLTLVVYAGCFFFPLMDKDAAHHANIALNMLQRNNYLDLIDRDKDYLDKPHLLFWASAASFKLFGINTFAHRFPAFLFSLLSLFSTYKLAKHLSQQSTAMLATALLATAQAFMFSIIDARMEAPLTAFIIFGTWQLIRYIDHQRLMDLVWAALGAALAFSTKGWLGPVVIFISVFFYLWLNNKWRVLAMARTWLFIPLFFIFIAPVLYAYYVQFDLHPEKIIRGRSHRSGLHFILWDQLFERSSGFDQGNSGRNSSYLFLFHTFLWAFFPWSIIAYTALIFWLRRMVSQKKWRQPFGFSVISFAFILFAISFSKFKMPHYIIMLLPLAALFTAPFIQYILQRKKWFDVFYPVQLTQAVVVILLCILLGFISFSPANVLVKILGPVALVVLLVFVFKRVNSSPWMLVRISCLLSLVLNFFLSYSFFPDIMVYQGGNEMVKEMKQKNINIPDSSIMLVELHAHSFDFYRHYNHKVIEAEDFPKAYPSIRDKYFLITPFLSRFLENKGFRIEPLINQPDYNVATVKPRFLNPTTRKQVLDTLQLVKIYRD